jgi:DNA-binding transcriptional MerR regulator
LSVPSIAPEALDSLITTTQAANLACVKVATISMWRDRGHLEPAAYDERGRPLYRFIDVARAERFTRDRARRTFPQGAA